MRSSTGPPPEKTDWGRRRWAAGGGAPYDLYAEHREAWESWSLVCDQWHLAPSGRVVRLDWPAALALLAAAGRSVDADRLAALRLVEREALAALADRGPG